MPLKTAISEVQHGFDYYVRSITTSVLAIGILGALIFEVVAKGREPQLLVGWAGIVVGVYFGYHVTANGQAIRKSAAADELQKAMQTVEQISELSHGHDAAAPSPAAPAAPAAPAPPPPPQQA